jgi:hypothetical protein
MLIKISKLIIYMDRTWFYIFLGTILLQIFFSMISSMKVVDDYKDKKDNIDKINTGYGSFMIFTSLIWIIIISVMIYRHYYNSLFEADFPKIVVKRVL